MKARPLPLLALALAALLVGACSTTQPVAERKHRASQPYEVAVRPMGPAVVSSDGFDARFVFEVRSRNDLQRNSLVQELHQIMTFEYRDGSTRERELTLVEAFRLRETGIDSDGYRRYRIYAGQSDRHSMRGLDDLPSEVIAVDIERVVFAYVANVVGADFTAAGFAQLPRNEDGNVVSKIPKKFNERYQRRHATRGWIHNSGDSLGVTYEINYRLVRQGNKNPQFVVQHGGGHGSVGRPTVLLAPER